MGFLAPVSINRILAYIENDGRDAFFRPWYVVQMHQSWSTSHPSELQGLGRVLLRVTCTLVSIYATVHIQDGMLPFIPAAFLDTQQGIQTQAMVQMQAIMTQLIFEHALRIRVKNTPAATGTSKPGAQGPTISGKKKKAKGSLEGRLNNLISSDLNAVTSARDFTLWFVYGPLQVILCFVFLYAILGWR